MYEFLKLHKKIFVTGTDTGVGKTFVSSLLCKIGGYDYFKPIQTGKIEGTDSDFIKNTTGAKIHKEVYLYDQPVSPHLAAQQSNDEIVLEKIKLPSADKLIVEGAGGVLVPINKNQFIVDLIKYLNLPVIVVCRSTLGTINHTLLTIEALKLRKIDIIGVVMNGVPNQNNANSVKMYGNVDVLLELPFQAL